MTEAKVDIDSDAKADVSKEEEEDIGNHGGMLKVMREYGKGVQCYMILGFFFSMLNGCVFPSFAILFQRLIDFLFGDPAQLNAVALEIMVQFIIVGGVAFLITTVQYACFGKYGSQIAVQVRKRYFQALITQEIAFYDKHNSGSLNSDMSSNATFIANGVGSKLGFASQNLVSFGAGIGVAFYYSWNLALIMFATLPALVLVGVVQGLMMKGGGTGPKADPFSQTGSLSNETFQNIKTVVGSPKLLTFKKKEYHRLLMEAYPKAVKSAMVVGVSVGMILFVMFGVIYAISIYFGSQLVADGKITAGAMMGCFFGFLIGGQSLGQLGSVIGDINKCKSSSKYFFYLLERKVQLKNYYNEDIQKKFEDNKEEEIVGTVDFENVRFAYPTAKEQMVIKGINLKAEKGNTVAIVGPSGSGKSTIINLLERYYDPVSGRISIDGRPIEDIHLLHLRKSIGYVSQFPLLFAESVKENVRHGNKDITDEEIIAACKFADCHDFIEQLPDKYDTNAGEMGSRLSGGQKQRLSIARAIVAKPSILLFDEATSALDTNSEREVQKAINAITSSKSNTIITIAHRLSTVKHCDTIMVVVDGVLQQSGTHEELMQERDGVYIALVKSQEVVAKEKKRRASRGQSLDLGNQMAQVVAEAAAEVAAQAEEEVGTQAEAQAEAHADADAGDEVDGKQKEFGNW